MFFSIITFLFILSTINSYKCNNTPLYNKNLFTMSMTPKNMLDVLTSIKEYTIITDNDENKKLVDLLNNINKNVYYINTNNLLDKENIIKYLKEKYSHLETGENLWIFYRGFILGSRNEIYNIIDKTNNK